MPYYLATRGAVVGNGSIHITYRNRIIIAMIGVFGAVAGGVAVEVPLLGRWGALACATSEQCSKQSSPTI
jgi:hypothetical protein